MRHKATSIQNTAARKDVATAQRVQLALRVRKARLERLVQLAWDETAPRAPRAPKVILEALAERLAPPACAD